MPENQKAEKLVGARRGRPSKADEAIPDKPKEYHGRSVIEVVMIKGNVKIDRKNLISILQSCLVLILVILVALMMVEIGNLKGTARVINYAGLVRGATQRAVKLEITGTRNDELIAYLDDILSDLTSGDGPYELVKLKDAAYQERLDIQRAYWERLKVEVAAARQRGYENTQIVAMSETYFEVADETVSAAEHYSEKIAMKIRTIEILSALDMLCLVILIMLQTAMALNSWADTAATNLWRSFTIRTGRRWRAYWTVCAGKPTLQTVTAISFLSATPTVGGWSPAALDTRLIRQADLAIAVTIHSCPPGTRFLLDFCQFSCSNYTTDWPLWIEI